MPRNTYFQFKQFRIEQDRCAMKVCTDACVLGAWAGVDSAKRILDIGTGTGLLSLMLAQRNPTAHIDAIELNEASAQQARENVANSAFRDKIAVHTVAVQAYTTEEQYDVIITNPPFYQSDLRSPDRDINEAHHAQTLTFADLIAAIHRLLKKTGQWFVLLPVEESLVLQQAAEAIGWVPYTQLYLAHQAGRSPFRRLTGYGRVETEFVTNKSVTLFIYENDGKTYTSEFRTLLKEYYLLF